VTPIRHRILTMVAVLWIVAVPQLIAQDDPLRGSAFVLGGVMGGGFFQGKSDLDSCNWWGVRAGHRFAPFSGVERVQFGFRAGWEGCVTEQTGIGRVDLVYVNVTFTVGIRVARSWLVYWGTGAGMLLGDTTFEPDGEVKPRPSIHLGPGVMWALGKHLVLDLSVFGIVFEGFDFGSTTSNGSTLGVIPTFTVALQI